MVVVIVICHLPGTRSRSVATTLAESFVIAVVGVTDTCGGGGGAVVFDLVVT